MAVMKQIDDCLTRFFTKKNPLRKKWQARLKEQNTFCLYHYHHLVLVYDFKNDKVVYQWWEKMADKRGLDSAKEWLENNKTLTKNLLK